MGNFGGNEKTNGNLFKSYLVFLLFSAVGVVSVFSTVILFTPSYQKTLEDSPREMSEIMLTFLTFLDFVFNFWYLFIVILLVPFVVEKFKIALKVPLLSAKNLFFLKFFVINLLCIGFLLTQIYESILTGAKLNKKTKFYQRTLSEINILSQADEEYAHFQQRFVESRLTPITDESQITERDIEIRIDAILSVIEYQKDTEKLRGKVGSLLLFKNFLAENPYYQDEVLYALRKITGLKYRKLDEYHAWYETVKDEEEWKPSVMYRIDFVEKKLPQ